MLWSDETRGKSGQRGKLSISLTRLASQESHACKRKRCNSHEPWPRLAFCCSRPIINSWTSLGADGADGADSRFHGPSVDHLRRPRCCPRPWSLFALLPKSLAPWASNSQSPSRMNDRHRPSVRVRLLPLPLPPVFLPGGTAAAAASLSLSVPPSLPPARQTD